MNAGLILLYSVIAGRVARKYFAVITRAFLNVKLEGKAILTNKKHVATMCMLTNAIILTDIL